MTKSKFINLIIVIVMYFILTIFMFYELKKYSFDVKMTFFLILSGISILLFLVISKNSWYFEANILTFYFLFFFFAPILQLKNESLPNTMIIDNNIIIKANLIIASFLILYIFFRVFLEKYKQENISKDFKINKSLNKIYMIIFSVLFIIFFKYFLSIILYRNTNNILLDGSLELIINKFVFNIPIYFLFYQLTEVKKVSKKNKRKLLLLFFLVILVINPFTTKRNALGPLYLTLIVLVLKKIKAYQAFYLVTLSMIVGFPVMAIITHSNKNILSFFNGDFLSNINFFQQFTELHFDAWSNLNANIQMVEYNLVKPYIQFIGAIFFFIPRSLWFNKPLSSGQVTGDYLTQRYAMNFNNLSCPLVSEIYISFGAIGIIIGAFIIAFIGKKCSEMYKRNNYYKAIALYISFYNIFLFRGDLMNAIAYLMGTLTAIYFFPLLLNKTLKIKGGCRL